MTGALRLPVTPPSLVILDCDGVLVDSERVTTRLLAEYLTELGVPTTVEDAIHTFKGTDLNVIAERLTEQLGRPFDGFVEGYRERMYPALTTCPAIEGAPEMLDAMDAAGVAWCVASNGPRTKMETTLLASGLADRIERARIYSAYEVGVWKPDPGLFLTAAEQLGHDPASATVIEDSTSGIRAARDAGMRAIGYADLTPRAVLLDAGAHEVIDSMHDAPRALGLAHAENSR